MSNLLLMFFERILVLNVVYGCKTTFNTDLLYKKEIPTVLKTGDYNEHISF